MMWKIRHLKLLDNHGKPKYWSEEVGWTWDAFATLYTEAEKPTTYFPPGGVWEEVY